MVTRFVAGVYALVPVCVAVEGVRSRTLCLPLDIRLQVLAELVANVGRTPPYDVLLMDGVMKRMDGNKSCRELRAMGIDLPIIAVTGNATVAMRTRYLADGFDGVLPKPFTRDDMRQQLSACVLHTCNTCNSCRKLPATRLPTARSAHTHAYVTCLFAINRACISKQFHAGSRALTGTDSTESAQILLSCDSSAMPHCLAGSDDNDQVIIMPAAATAIAAATGAGAGAGAGSPKYV